MNSGTEVGRVIERWSAAASVLQCSLCREQLYFDKAMQKYLVPYTGFLITVEQMSTHRESFDNASGGWIHELFHFLR